ncbi:RNA 2'-phosphotransferase [Rhodopirellula sp. MGV]|nr:RNA 2'-phosphotransferase [Rhodopirellula sp. MGV]PNY33595.1 RNA 2'-phosphotransferase [Rhodopirellula baltica]
MNHKNNLVAVSKFLSLVLRHRPDVIGVELDSEGWVEIEALISQANTHGKSLTLEQVHEAIVNNDKKRFALSDDGLRIRANQGHSVAGVDLLFDAAEPPKVLYHGTVSAFLERIRRQGLQKRSRHHVHLSSDRVTAEKVGSRRGKPVVLTVDAATMFADGHVFFLSANGVWLVDAVPEPYLAFPVGACE